MSDEQSEGIDDERPTTSIDSDEARAILDTQVQLLRRLNDELLRTIRLHALFGGGVVTAISVLGVNSLTVSSATPSNQAAWVLSFFVTMTVAPRWVIRLLSERVSYSELALGTHPEAGTMPYSDKDSEPDCGLVMNTISSIVDLVSDIVDIMRGIGVLLFATITVERSENQIDPEDVKEKMIAENHTDAIHYNTWILQTREDYVNNVQKYLNASFILYLFGLAGMYIF